MHILCTICSDLINPAENINVTKCGHIFHYNCLLQWIVRSQSCPQCRNKVTERCMFRIYPTVSNDNSGEDATTLQSRLDDAHLQLRQQKVTCNEKDDKIKIMSSDLKRNEDILKDYEKKLVTKESAVGALKEQLKYVQIQNKETQRLKQENEVLNKNLQTLNGLQKVLNATSVEVEQMLEGYTDVRTIATFATALKRALCESESKKNESRDKLQMMKQQMGNDKNIINELRAKLVLAKEEKLLMRRKYKEMKNKTDIRIQEHSAVGKEKTTSPKDDICITENRDVSFREDENKSKVFDINDTMNIITSENNTSFNTLVNRIENADSPYLSLKQSSLALTALQRHPTHPLPEKNLKPSEFAILNSAKNTFGSNKTSPSKHSIFHKRDKTVDFRQENDASFSELNISYDGLGGHSRLDTFPKPLKSCVPKLTARHKLKRPTPAGSFEKFFKKVKDDSR